MRHFIQKEWNTHSFKYTHKVLEVRSHARPQNKSQQT